MAERKAGGGKGPAKKTPARRRAGTRSREAAPAEPRPRPVGRLFQVYLYTVAFVTVLILLFAGARAVFGLVRVAIPGETAKQAAGFGEPFWEYEVGSETGLAFPEPSADRRAAERRRGAGELGEAGVLAVIALVVFRLHWRRADDLRPKPGAGET